MSKSDKARAPSGEPEAKKAARMAKDDGEARDPKGRQRLEGARGTGGSLGRKESRDLSHPQDEEAGGKAGKLFGRGLARTDPDAHSPSLRGRTFGISFDRVWNQALDLITRRSRWTIMRADDEAGIIDVTVETLVFHFVDDVRITISLDGNGQTRVDMVSASRKGVFDFRSNARRIRRFLRDLDRALG